MLLVFEFLLIAALSALLYQADYDVQQQLRSRDILSKANSLSKSFYDAGVAIDGYKITKSPLFSDRYDKLNRQIFADLTELKTLFGDNAREQQILKNLAVITETGFKILDDKKMGIDQEKADDDVQFRARHMYKEVRSINDRLQEEVFGLTESERKLAQESSEGYVRVAWLVKCCLAIGIILNAALAVVALLNSRSLGSAKSG